MNILASEPCWTDRWWSVAPDVGIYIGAGYLSTAAIAPPARRHRLEASHVEALPEGVVVPSPVESNIRRPDIVIERLKAAVPAPKRRETAISLPDAAVRVAILELARVPVKRAEQEALFRHHLERLFLNPLGRCRFASQRLTPAGTGTQRVLVAAIHREILEEYEAVVRAAGLRPSVVDLSAFHLFNLYGAQICDVLPPERRVVFLNLFDRNFTMIVADRNGPRLIRIKAFPGAVGETDLLARVLAELDASLRASDAAATGDEQPIERVFVFSDRPLDGLDQRVREDYHVETVRLRSNEAESPVGESMQGTGEPGPNGAAGSLTHGNGHAVTVALAAVGWRARTGTNPEVSSPEAMSEALPR
jgi:Tfp pilus assembly PilM family ATPase